ncbi:ATP-binding cassette sub-family C member 4-like [Aphidius gifuensis]|uniref:ATP-binding cassette sub-family C member 4-like n=1 Tax=Aphidius gifuensis TaxID=684658 RepID=UPI001CDC78CF|nr:ATP-binding cassette sub-family C member 4-like [Aphidius gifuensis]
MKKKVFVKKANPLSRLFFWWTIRIFNKGSKNNLTVSDIGDPLSPDRSEKLGDSLEREWQKEIDKLKNSEYKIDDDGKKNGKTLKPSLLNAIIRTFKWQYFHCGVFQFLQSILFQTLQPVFQGWVINYFDVNLGLKKTTRNEAYLSALGLVLTTLAIVFIMHHMNLSTQRIGMRVRVACSSLIYRKSLKLSQSALDSTGAGQIINLLSNDINRFDTVFMFLNYLWIVPIQIVVVGSIIWNSVGTVACAVGIGFLLIVSFPIMGAIAIFCGKLREVIADLTDQRVQLMSELVTGIQVVKMYAWEIPFDKIVSNIRRLEIKKISIASYCRGLYSSFMIFTERTTLFLTIITFLLMGNILTAEISFQLASYFNTLQMTTTIFFPMALIMLGETLISIKRIENFLLLDEVSSSASVTNKKYDNHLKIKNNEEKLTGKVSMEFKRASANWINGQLPPTLCNISVKIEGGILCSLIGPVGSGKSSFLNMLLRELPLGAGNIELYHSDTQALKEGQSRSGFITNNHDIKISYASQDSWLFSGTVRDNILFGQDYDRIRYQQVTTVCSLIKDFKQFSNGDMTIIGERGAALSGGQRARVNLARAIYQQADIYLLDDPLSAVDTKVARRLFKDCIVDFLKDKTRILVTHQLHFLRQSDKIVLLERGLVKCQGTYDYLTKTSNEFNNLLDRMEEESTEDTTPDHLNITTNDNIEYNNQLISRRRRSSRMSSRRSSVRSIDSYYFASNDENDASKAEGKSSAQAEAIATGKLSNSVYTRYFKEGGGTVTLFFLIFFFILAQVASSMVDYWLSYLTNLENVRNAFTKETNQTILLNSDYLSIVNNSIFNSFNLLDDHGILPRNYTIYIYTVLIIACIILNIVRVFFFMMICMKASRKLHNEMFKNILNATMLFFNTTPIGRILNRFSKDTGAMDELLPKTMLEAVQIFLVMIGILVMIVIVNLWMLIPIFIIGIIFYNVRIYFLKTAQDLKRIEGTAKSPIFSHVSATLNGLPTIRSHSRTIQTMLINEFDKHQDNHTSVWYLIISIASAFGMLLDLISCVFIAYLCFSLILMDPSEISSGSVGLAISQCLILTGMLQIGVRQSADIQSQMTAIERILQYTDLPKEKLLDSISTSSWPSHGRIQFKNVSMSYTINDPPVLKNLNVTIEPCWKVGVVGRTGAGKSSLISALFRLTGEGLRGSIIIDEKDTSKINLQDLRSSISIIPQEPVLFSQSLRYNLDPFEKYQDGALFDALREVELADYKLDEMVTEGGTNFSVGQRQLICLARAILRSNKILVLDEATANIDTRTDALIQRTIQHKFHNCTVITIAHRLDTIIDSDRIIVMDNGTIVEFDSPYKLLINKPSGHFSKMVEQLGSSMAENLLEQATASYHKKNDNITRHNLNDHNDKLEVESVYL